MISNVRLKFVEKTKLRVDFTFSYPALHMYVAPKMIPTTRTRRKIARFSMFFLQFTRTVVPWTTEICQMALCYVNYEVMKPFVSRKSNSSLLSVFRYKKSCHNKIIIWKQRPTRSSAILLFSKVKHLLWFCACFQITSLEYW